MAKKPVRYPIGIQSFESLRTLGYLYVDKTEFIYDLVTNSKCVFLSRPRRFGKSLLLSTIQAYFEGKKDLFTGVAMEELESEWPVHPVLALSLTKYNPLIQGSLEEILDNQFLHWEDQYGVRIKASNLASRFENIIKAAYEVSGRPVVILIDEYDNPTISTMHDPERSESHLQLLKSIYVNIKDLDQYIRFTMLTGVSRFSKMTIFSGLNNLEDISLNRTFASICGITEQELKENFQVGIEGIAEEYQTDSDGTVAILKVNYDGYHFTRNSPDIYNPFSLLRAFKECEIGAYWFQTATPEFLIRRIRQSGEFLPQMFDKTVEQSILSSIDMSMTSPIALLYQTGYLTIKDFEKPDLYHLGIPNLEVSKGLFEHLARCYFNEDSTAISQNVREVRKLLEEKRIDEAMERLQTFMAEIPYEFAGDPGPIINIGVSFSTKTRNITAWRVEQF